MRPILAALAFALLCIAAGPPEPASAQSYPSRPVRIVVPLAPGGPTDVFARLIAGKLSENLGKQFFVENMPGAGGNIGLGSAAKAAPDGYTILVVSNLYVVNPTLYEKISYEPYRDFEPVTLALDVANVVAVNPSVPVKTLKELEVFIKANPGKHSYASGGLGTTPHLMGEQFRLQLGLDLVHVPFNSGGLAVGSAIAGHTPIASTPEDFAKQIRGDIEAWGKVIRAADIKVR
jgi:tripartite-type tricarboxylate transporter receptor subunit TctC